MIDLAKNSNIIPITSLESNNLKAEIAEHLEAALRSAVEVFEMSSGYHILGADIMFKNDQIFVGMNSVKYEKN